MKKAISVILCAVLLLCACIPISAAEGDLKANELAAYGQKTHYVGGKTQKKPTINAVIEKGEYSYEFTYRPGDEGTWLADGLQNDTNKKYIPEYVTIGTSYDDDYLYFGITVKENYFGPRVKATGKSYSYFLLNLGFNQSGLPDDANTRIALTLALVDDGSSFSAGGFMNYDYETNKLPAGTDYTVGGKAFHSRNMKRYEDEKLTVYEFQLKKNELKSMFGVENLDLAYIYGWAQIAEGTSVKGTFRYGHMLSAGEKTALTTTMKNAAGTGNGWCSSFVGHLMHFGYKDIATADTASIRLNSPSGLRFTTTLEKGFYDSLVEKYGAENVKVGTLITPESYVTEAGAFTKAALDTLVKNSEKNYLNIYADEFFASDAQSYTFVGSVVNILDANKTLKFAGIGYVQAGDEIFYSDTWAVRSVAEVAAAALADTAAAESDAYPYQVSEGVFSPYTEAERAVLAGFVAN